MASSVAILGQAKNTPLSLAEILTGLQSKSGGYSIEVKNSFITAQVRSRGTTFRLSTEIENELRRAGADESLIAAIKSKSFSSTSPVRDVKPNSTAEFDRLWIDYNLIEDGVKGMRVHTKFTLVNLENENLQLTVRVQKKDGDPLMSADERYRNKSGQFAAYKNIRAGYPTTVFDDISVFLPYNAFNIAPGDHTLEVDADLIYPDGDLIKHFTLFEFAFSQPKIVTSKTTKPITRVSDAPNGSVGSVTLDKIWIDFGETQNGKMGMQVHAKATVSQLKETPVQFVFGVERADGTKILGKTMRSINGQLTGYVNTTPQYDDAAYSDVKAFIPYDEIVVSSGAHNLRVHIDLIRPETNLNLHLGYREFEFKKP